MINNTDCQVVVKFGADHQPYFTALYKGEPFKIEKDEYRELEDVFRLLAYEAGSTFSRLETEEKLTKVKANLEDMNMDDANRILSDEGKRLWVEMMFRKGYYHYRLASGKITEIPLEGIWK